MHVVAAACAILRWHVCLGRRRVSVRVAIVRPSEKVCTVMQVAVCTRLMARQLKHLKANVELLAAQDGGSCNVSV